MIPKFRAWDRLTGKMFPVGIIDCSIQAVYIEEPNGLDSCRNFDEIELMQSTGLKDENGREIYEGDILKCTSFDGSFWYETVLWDSTLAGFAAQQNGYDATAISYITDSKAITVEIIGDIYQNSELVEVK